MLRGLTVQPAEAFGRGGPFLDTVELDEDVRTVGSRDKLLFHEEEEYGLGRHTVCDLVGMRIQSRNRLEPYGQHALERIIKIEDGHLMLLPHTLDRLVAILERIAPLAQIVGEQRHDDHDQGRVGGLARFLKDLGRFHEPPPPEVVGVVDLPVVLQVPRLGDPCVSP